MRLFGLVSLVQLLLDHGPVAVAAQDESALVPSMPMSGPVSARRAPEHLELSPADPQRFAFPSPPG